MPGQVKERINGFRVKGCNRRVFGARLKDGTYYWKFKSLQDGEIVEAKVRLSKWAVMAMFSIMAELEANEPEGERVICK